MTQAFEQLYCEMFKTMYFYAHSILRNESLAEDAVQDAFHIAWVRADKLFESENPKGWLIKTLYNVLRNTSRSQSAFSRVFADTKYAEQELSRAAENDDYFSIYYSELLHRKDYVYLRLGYIEGLSIHEIAAAENISIEACKKRIQRAREKLRKELEND